MKKACFLPVFCLFFSVAYSQFDHTKEERNIASTTVQELRNKVLVVRLKTKQRQVEAYRNAGKENVAKRIEEKQLIENFRIVGACIKYFNFAKIYFVNTEDVEYFQQTDRLILSNLLPMQDSVITLNHDSVFYLDYGYLYDRQPAGNTYSFKDYGKTQEGSQIVSENAFVIRNSNNEQLVAPMPFYSVRKTGKGKSKERAAFLKPYLQLNAINSNSEIEKQLADMNLIDNAVVNLNNRLIEFYNKVTGENHYSIKWWYDNNPNAELYPKWIIVQKKFQKMQNAEPQFISQ